MPRAIRAKPKKPEPRPDELYIPSPLEINEPPESLWEYTSCLYGTKGIGKTTLAASIPNSITLMAEPRRRNLKIRQISLQLHTARQIMDGATDLWEQIKDVTGRIIEDETINHINYDSVDLIYEACRNSISASHGVENPSKAGKDSSTVWIEVADEFRAYMDTVAETGTGMLFLSHTKERDVEVIDGTKMTMHSPSCAPACLLYIKQACDFAFFYGYYNNTRAICVRDNTNMVWTASGVNDTFMQPDKKELSVFEMPNDQKNGYRYLEKAFNNEMWDIDTPEDERTLNRPVKKKRRPVK